MKMQDTSNPQKRVALPSQQVGTPVLFRRLGTECASLKELHCLGRACAHGQRQVCTRASLRQVQGHCLGRRKGIA